VYYNLTQPGVIERGEN